MTIRRFATNITNNIDFSMFDGNAVPGELVVNLEEDPPVLYISDNTGNLTAVATVATVNGDDITGNVNTDIIVTNERNPLGIPGSGVIINENGNLKSSWLLTMDEDHNQIISQAKSFVFSGGPVNMQSPDTSIQLPDGGTISAQYFIIQPGLQISLGGMVLPSPVTPIPSSGSPTLDFTIPISINGVPYFLPISSTG